MSLREWLLGTRRCPRCRQELIEYEDTDAGNGYIWDRSWVACPVYTSDAPYDERRLHYGVWHRRNLRPNVSTGPTPNE